MAERKLCFGCMLNTDYHNGTCQRCGYNENVAVNAVFIQPGTELNQRYIVGTALSMNGEGITYIALDRSIGCRVLLREYMPLNLCSRVDGSPLIRVNPSKLPQYKVLMEEFTDLNKSLAQMREQVQINTVVDMFAENNSTYIVFEYIEGMRFVDFLKENAGELSWGQLSGMLPPFLTTLSILHNSGVIHRAISPETIYVTQKCELKLTDFSISAVRTADTELDCEIFSGYAAPEQYSASNRQGTWTDVYAVCAVLYRVLTGSMPTSAISRMEDDNLIAPCLLNPNISRHISDVIMKGLNLVSADRIQTITELVTQLFSEQRNEYGAAGRMPQNRSNVQNRGADHQAGTAAGYQQQNYGNEYYDDPNAYNHYGQQEYTDDYSYDDYGNESYQRNSYQEPQPSAIDRVKVPLIIGMLLLVILLIGLYFMFSRGDAPGSESSQVVTSTVTTAVSAEDVEKSTETTTPEGDGIMPNLVGKNFDTQAERYSSWMKFSVEEVFDDTEPAGTIVWQEIAEGAYFDTSKPVKIQVSKGPSLILLPNYSNVYVGDYTKQLDELGVKYRLEAETTADCAANTVSKLSMDIQNQYDLEKAEEIVVYYAVAPVTTEATTTVAPTEAPTEAPTQAPTEAPTQAPTEAPVVTEAPLVDPALQAGGFVY
ncbi:MAG: protein kinase [Ruminococcus sp.]|nr:protein kinase [Ruminococcus sp.]